MGPAGWATDGLGGAGGGAQPMARGSPRATPELVSPLESKEARVSATQCVSQLSLIPQEQRSGEWESPIPFLLALPFGTPENQTPSRHRLRDTPSQHPGLSGCFLPDGANRPGPALTFPPRGPSSGFNGPDLRTNFSESFLPCGAMSRLL